jgi:flavin-dependent dehydrogenase
LTAGGVRAPERVDAVVVGARPAGAATAIALARGGRHVVALDKAHFPSDTLSTHLLFAGGVAEIARVGALERVQALGAPPMPDALMAGAGENVRARYTPVDGIDYGMCVRRIGLDAALIATAREAGVEVRERARVTELVRGGGRVAGVSYTTGEGREVELRAPLVVGADGRRSTVARLVGATEPHRAHRNGRACFFAYLEDGRPDWRGIAAQWREGRELGTAFPCDEGLVLVLLMPPLARASDFAGAGLEREWEKTVAGMPGLRERLEGSKRVSKVRSALDTTSYFRRSAGPGWALPGDAGHFKDPVTAQGIRDALRFGRLLGEAVAPVLDDPIALDRASTRWARRRERECLETYTWTNALGRAEPMTALEAELYAAAARDPELARRVLDVFSRTRRPSRAVGVRTALEITRRALNRPGADRRLVLRAAGRELRDRLVAEAQRREAWSGSLRDASVGPRDALPAQPAAEPAPSRGDRRVRPAGQLGR